MRVPYDNPERRLPAQEAGSRTEGRFHEPVRLGTQNSFNKNEQAVVLGRAVFDRAL